MAHEPSGSAKQLHLTVVTPARKIYDDKATALVAPAYDGELGVLPGHANLMALLGAGEVRITQPNGSRKFLAVRGGFLQVSGSTVTVLTPESVGPEEVDAGKVDKEIEALKAEQLSDLEKRGAREAKLKWALTRRKVLDHSKGVSRN